jgi:hypothetical protein
MPETTPHLLEQPSLETPRLEYEAPILERLEEFTAVTGVSLPVDPPPP